MNDETKVVDALAVYSRTDGRREWVTVGAWLHPGDSLVLIRDKQAPNSVILGMKENIDQLSKELHIERNYMEKYRAAYITEVGKVSTLRKQNDELCAMLERVTPYVREACCLGIEEFKLVGEIENLIAKVKT